MYFKLIMKKILLFIYLVLLINYNIPSLLANTEKLAIVTIDTVKKSFSTYTEGEVSLQEEKADYDIMRYRNLSMENIIKEVENEQ